jgi:phosphatidylglycerophosphate synthase
VTVPFDGVIVADSPHAGATVLGLTLVERGRRVAAKLGARRIYVVDGAHAAAGLAPWDEVRGDANLLVIRAGDQVVHVPLVEPLLRGTQDHRIAVGPDGAYAGALWVAAAGAREAITAIAAAPATGDRELAQRWTTAERHVHGDIARHVATTAVERAGATRMLLRLIVKREDSAVTNYIYRPLSRPLTRLLLHTRVTPNQVSIFVGILGLIGCWLTAHAGQTALVAGAATVFGAGILDGCDGEIARLRLTTSKLGAWLDTVIDELTTTTYFIAIGYHVHGHEQFRWLVPTIALGTLAYAAMIYSIYYFLIIVSKTGNSQHYIGDLEIVDGGAGASLRARPRGPSTLPPWLRKIGALLPLVVRRDFVNLAALALAMFDGYLVIYVAMLAGGLIGAASIVPEHIKLRGLLREVQRRGAAPRLLSS